MRLHAMESGPLARRPASKAAAVALVGVLMAGCLPRDPDPADTTLIDSVMAPAPEVVVDTVVQYPPRLDASGDLTGETTRRGEGRNPRGDIIGRDSAFGPIGTMDSLGRIEPIRR